MKQLALVTMYTFVFLFIFGCTNKETKTDTNKLKQDEMISKEKDYPNGTIMLIVKAKTTLSEEELLRVAKEREPQFAAIPGLIQKYYIKTKTEGEFGGVYIWDSMESLNKYKESELAATIAKAYKTIGPPSTEIIDIMFALR